MRIMFWISFRYICFRIGWQGNPREYAVWTDESLNLLLRTVVQHVHALRFDERTLASMNLIGALRLNKFIVGTEEEGEIDA